MEFALSIALGLIGAALGSFAAATVWRLRARQLAYDKAHREPYNAVEYKQLKKLLGKRVAHDRSQCLHCSYQLAWYDMIPVVSWLSLRGRCRNCKKRIGYFEIVSEIGLAAFFVVSYLFWPIPFSEPFAVVQFVAWLCAGVCMAILIAYDYKWFLLPDRVVLALAFTGLVAAVITVAQSSEPLVAVISIGTAMAILGGLYAVLHFVSKGAWVGFGDVKLGFALGLLLANWQLAFIALFLANLIGCLIVIPLLAMKKLTPQSRVPFGPLFIAGAVLAWFTGPGLLEWYGSLLALPL